MTACIPSVVIENIVAMIGMSYLASFQVALIIILVKNIVCTMSSVFNVHEKIVESIPSGIRLGINTAIGIGLLIYTIMKTLGGKAKAVSALSYAISALFLL